MATSVVLGTRPKWARSTSGIPVETVVRIHPGTSGAKPDLSFSRNRVSVSRVPGASARPEDEFDVGYVYGPEATHSDIAARSLLPLLRKFVDGYNVTVMAFGPTGSGKTYLLEGGSSGRERGSTDGSGLVHISADEVYKLLGEKAVVVGTAMTSKRHAPSTRAFDFFLEATFLELYREELTDLYRTQQKQQHGPQHGAGPAPSPLQVYEDATEGYQVAGVSTCIVRSAGELRAAFNSGRVARNALREDVGSVSDRTAALFSLQLAQFCPAAVPGEEDRILVSRLQFVDLPGSERLADDPELLRLREGPTVHRSLLALGATLRQLAEGVGGVGGGGQGGAFGGGGAGGVPYVDYEGSVLTKLLADALGGNSLCLAVGLLRQGDGSSGLQPTTTLRYLGLARGVRNVPVINHGRSRGLIQKLRHRLLTVMEDRQTLRELSDAAPVEGDPASSLAMQLARLRDTEARLLAVRYENAELLEEKRALQARLEKLRKAEEGELEEREELQESLIQSEEQRLQLSRALIDFQMEYNEAQQEWEAAKYELQAKLIEAEAQCSELPELVEQLQDTKLQREVLEKRVVELEAQLLHRSGGQAAGQEAVTPEVDGSRGETESRLTREELEALEAWQQQGAKRLEEQETQILALQSELSSVRQLLQQLTTANGTIHRASGDTELGPGDTERPLGASMSQQDVGVVAEPTRATLTRDMGVGSANWRHSHHAGGEWLPPVSPPTEGRPMGPSRGWRLTSPLTSAPAAFTPAARVTTMRDSGNDPPDWPREVRGQPPPPGGWVAAASSREEQGMATTALYDRRPPQGAGGPWGPPQPPPPPPQQQPLQQHWAEGSVRSSGVGPQAAATALPSPAAPDPGLLRENSRLREEVERLQGRLAQAEAAAAAATRAPSTASKPGYNSRQAASDGIIRQLKEFNTKTLSELQRRAQSSETRAVMAEEQLEQLQSYLSKSSIAYQREIVRLRSIIGQMENSVGAAQGSYLNLNPLEGVGGGGALRPAAEVMDEIAARGSVSRRGSSPQVGGSSPAQGLPRGSAGGGGGSGGWGGAWGGAAAGAGAAGAGPRGGGTGGGGTVGGGGGGSTPRSPALGVGGELRTEEVRIQLPAV